MDWGDLALAALAVLLVFLGAALTILIELARGQLERKQRRQDRRNDFQRETLLELQESLYSLFEAMAHMIKDYEEHSAGRIPSSILRGLDWATVGRAKQARTIVLSVRIADEQTRTLVWSFFDTLDETYMKAVTAEQAKAALEQIRPIFRQTNERIGDLLRSL